MNLTCLRVSEIRMAKDIQMNIISCLAISRVHAGVPSSGAVLFCAININEFKKISALALPEQIRFLGEPSSLLKFKLNARIDL